jgi:hypothetical protein
VFSLESKTASAKKMSHRWLLRRRPVTEVVSRRDIKIVLLENGEAREKRFKKTQPHCS